VTYIPEARPRRRVTTPRRLDGSGRRVTSPAGNPALERRLAQEKAARAERQSRIRALLSRRNEAVAAAIVGGVPVAAVSATSELKLTEVRKIAGAFSESYNPELSREQLLAELDALAEQLRTVNDEKERAERQLRADIVAVLRTGEMDIFRIAALTAVTTDRLREITRGTGLRSQAFRLGS
jgi:hypothetical protein